MDLEPVMGGLARVAARLEERFPGRPITLLSSLAEGADRLVARFFLDRGATLVAPLPASPRRMAEALGDDASRRELAELLARALEQRVVAAPTDSGEHALIAAGRYVLDRSDALIAIWDGAPARSKAGTGTWVALARRRGLPLAWIAAGNRRDGSDEPTSLGRDQGRVTFERMDQIAP